MVLTLLAAMLVTQTSRVVTLDEALELARRQSPLLRAARHREDAAVEEERSTRAAWAPTLGGLGELVAATTNNSTATVVSSSVIDLPRIGATSVSTEPDFVPHATTVLAVGLRQLVWDFGKLSAQQHSAEARHAFETQRVRAMRLDLDLTVRRSYYDVLAAKAVLFASTQAAVRAQANADFAKAAVAAQLRPPIDKTRAEADVARTEVTRLRAQSALRSARIRLAAAVGSSDAELDAAEIALAPSPLPTDEVLRVAAARNDPLLQAARALAQAREFDAAALAAQTRPTLSATASLSVRGGGATASNGGATVALGLAPTVPNYSGGLVLSWPLFDATVPHRAAAAVEQARSLDDDYQQLVIVITSRASDTLEAAHLADAALEALERGATAATANAAQADARFRAGLGTSTELADAESLRTNADIALAIGRFEAHASRALVTRAWASD